MPVKKPNKLKFLVQNIKLVDILVALVLVFLFGLLFLTKSRTTEQIYLELTNLDPNSYINPIPPEYWQIQQFNLGDAVYIDGNQFGSVVDKEISSAYADRQYVFLTIKASVLYSKALAAYQINNKTLRIGETVSLNINHTKFDGKITDVYTDPANRSFSSQTFSGEITIRYKNLEPEHAVAIQDFVQKNSKNEIIAEVIHSQIEPAKVITNNYFGDIFEKRHPRLKDITLTVRLPKITCAENDCYFNRLQPLKVGYPIWFSSQSAGIGLPLQIHTSGIPDTATIIDVKINWP